MELKHLVGYYLELDWREMKAEVGNQSDCSSKQFRQEVINGGLVAISSREVYGFEIFSKYMLIIFCEM